MHGIVCRKFQPYLVIHFARRTNIDRLHALARGVHRGHPQRRNRPEIHARRRYHEIPVLADVILQMERFRRILDRVHLHVVDVSRKTPARREHLRKIAPSRLRHASETCAHWPIAIPLRCEFHRGIQRSILAELPLHHKAHECTDRRIRRRSLQPALRALGRHDGLLVAQLIKQKPVRRHFLRSIQPRELLSHPGQCHHVIELRRRGLVFVQFARAVNQHRITLDPYHLEHRRQQCVLILAITVSVLQNFRRRVRLVSSDAQRNAHVPDIESHKVIEPPRLLLRSRRSLRQVLRLFPNRVIDRHALALQLRIPARDLLPIRECRQLDIRASRLIRILIFVSISLRLNSFHYPRIDPAIPVLLNLRRMRGRFELDFPALGNIDLEPILGDDDPLRKSVDIPEIVPGQRRSGARHRPVFERVSGAQRCHRNMTLPEICVHRCFLHHLGGEILRR